jgi:3-keto-5-aminohexanoate cleavage enzyme
MIRKKSDVIINCTTGGNTFQEKIDVLKIYPEIATLNCGSANLREKMMLNPPHELIETAKEMLERGVKPEIMIHSQGFVKNAIELISMGLVDHPPFFNIFFASGGINMNLQNLVYIRDSLPEGSIWSATGYGGDAFNTAVLAMIGGGHTRIGLEDCFYLAKDEPATSNAQLVSKVVRLAKELDLDIATPDEARIMLGIN